MNLELVYTYVRRMSDFDRNHRSSELQYEGLNTMQLFVVFVFRRRNCNMCLIFNNDLVLVLSTFSTISVNLVIEIAINNKMIIMQSNKF